MEEIVLLDRHSDGAARAYHADRSWKRAPGAGGDGEPQWTNDVWPFEVADSGVRQLLERAYEDPTTPAPPRHPLTEFERKPGQLVFHEEEGVGKIVANPEGKFVVKFRKHERVLRADQFMTLAEAQIQWHFYWLTGRRRRIEEGRRLWIVKKLCRYGEWQAFLDKYEYPRTTADDLIKLFKAESRPDEDNLHGNRASQPEDTGPQDRARATDQDEVERREQVEKEIDKRRGRQPTHNRTSWTVRIDDLTPEVVLACKMKLKHDKKRAKKFWRRCANKFAGVKPAEKKDQH
jgi:hypothetical protein